jgi:hypothetical protein
LIHIAKEIEVKSSKTASTHAKYIKNTGKTPQEQIKIRQEMMIETGVVMAR